MAKAKECYYLSNLGVGGRRLLKLFSSSSSFSNPLWPFPGVGLHHSDPERFLLFATCKVFPFIFLTFLLCSFYSILGLPLPRVNSTLVSHTCLGFMLLSILIRWPNHLSFLLSTILVTSSWFSIPLIWLLLTLSPPVFQEHFLKYLISAPVNLPSCLLNIVLLYEPQSSAGRQAVL